MGNAARVLLRDIKRLAKTPAAWSVALFLVVLPSLYTWFNVAGFWNPYDNTGNLRVCVVNEDEGAFDETLGELDLGTQLVEQLESNDQLGWAFVDYGQAMDEISSGSAYAAFVIPPDFSADVATLVTGDFQQPQLDYYVNEKTGPVSPKITDTGANALDTTINDAFFSTVSSTVVAMLNERLDDAKGNVSNAKGKALEKVDTAIEGIGDARASLARLDESTASAIEKTERAQSTLSSAKTHLDMLSAGLITASDDVAEANTGLAKLSGETNSALDKASGELARVSRETTLAITQTNAALDRARSIVDSQTQLTGEWATLKKALDDAAIAAEGTSKPVEDLVDNTLSRSDDYRNMIATSTVPTLSAGLAQISSTSASLSASVSNQKLLLDQTSLILEQLKSTLSLSGTALANTDRSLANLQDSLKLVQKDLSALGSSQAIQKIMGDDGIDPDKVADFMMAPTQITSEELYPMNAYGSAMAPLFINLTLWIGVFMLMVIVRLEVDDEEIEKLTITQRFFGRGALLSILASAQAAVCCTGCLLLGVQTASAPMFYLTAIIASLAYLSIQYTLSTTLQHVGKGVCVILVFVQIPAATGLYPIEMTPDFFHVIYPLFPFTYGINAIRETISGFYGNLWLYNVGMLALFYSIFMLIGVLVRPYLTNLNRLFAREIEESDIINGESVQLPARRYRMSQIIQALADRDEYREELNSRITRFVGLYPKLISYAMVIAVIAPLLATAILSAAHVDKVIILSTWLAWLALVVTYLVVVEYFNDYFSHLVSLETMSDDEMRSLYANRDRFTRVRPLIENFGRNATASSRSGNGEKSGIGQDDDEEGADA